MIPVVNQRYKFILLYSAKAGCTSLRSLYLDVHRDELTTEQLSDLDEYHNLNEVHAYDPEQDYSNYFAYIITRNPYSRVVSAFLDQYVFLRHEGVNEMFENCPPQEGLPNNFIEFLEFLKSVPDSKRDSHFQTQAYFSYTNRVVTPSNLQYRFFKLKPEHALGVNYIGDIAGFEKHTRKVFKRVFRHDQTKLSFALEKLAQLRKRNSSFYGRDDYPNAASLDIKELDEMVYAPKPQDFYVDPIARKLVQEIYQEDFNLFDYPVEQVPEKEPSKEINSVPRDFDWKMYLRLNPDLPRDEIYNERSVVRHYLEFGRFEATLRAYKIAAPVGFDWQRYLNLHDDLPASGITSEKAAIEHYISYGIREQRAI